MPDPRGFLKVARQPIPKRPARERIGDWQEIYLRPVGDTVSEQASRCMDCGVPFCQSGCPLGNLIPEWNDLVFRGRWREAADRLHATNNFPEFTGKLCPAPCEASCVLNINSDPVSIKQIELAIIDRAFEEGWVLPEPPPVRTGKSVAIVGSGPAGLAAAQQLNRSGHLVTVFERDDRIGGLLRYGIPDFKMDKALVDRRLTLLAEEGIRFRLGVDVGVDISAAALAYEYDAVLLAVGSTTPRDLNVPGRHLDGIHFAMDYLAQQNRRLAGDHIPPDDIISAEGKHVVILGGGDTGADCLGTAHRQGAASVVQLQRWPEPGPVRSSDNPWPQWPQMFQMSPAHEEGGSLEFAVVTERFSGHDQRVEKLHASRGRAGIGADGKRILETIPDSAFDLAADLVLIAIGYGGPEQPGVVADFGLHLTRQGTIAAGPDAMTSNPGVFAAGDASHGQSLIVTAIAEGRRAAAGIDRYLATIGDH